MSSHRIDEIEIEKYAASVHGAMATGYALLIPYHLKRRNWHWLAVGIIGLAFHVWSVGNHRGSPDTEQTD